MHIKTTEEIKRDYEAISELMREIADAGRIAREELLYQVFKQRCIKQRKEE